MNKACDFLAKVIWGSKIEDDKELEKTLDLPTLPWEIIEDILLRLPVKPLGRFRCVCKDWRNLLSADTEFIRKHLTRQLENPGFIVGTKFPKKYLFALNARYEQTIKLKSSSPVERIYRRYKSASQEIIGSSNGLVCFCSKNFFSHSMCSDIYIWNPATEEYKKLPPARLHSKMRPLLGFGHHSNNEDYNVVRITKSRHPIQVEVYSLRKNTWKTLPVLPDHYQYYRTPAANLNGALHWLARCRSASGDYDMVLGFDMAKEVWRELLVSHNMNPVDVYKLDVRSFKGHLSVLAVSNTDIQIWVMNDYGLKESWTKFFTIPCAPYRCPAIVFLDNGEVLLSESMQPPLFWRYNIEQRSRQKLTIQGVDNPLDIEILPYAESLVPVVIHKQVQKERSLVTTLCHRFPSWIS